MPTSVVAVVLEVYKHGAHIGLFFHVLQCCRQTRIQGEKSR